MSEELIDGLAYVAHPYGGKAENKALSQLIVEEISKKNQCLILINPLTLFSYVDYDSTPDGFTTQMEDCLSLLSRCDYLIMTGDWQNSKGCMCEWGYAKARRDIQIFDWYNGELHEM